MKRKVGITIILLITLFALIKAQAQEEQWVELYLRDGSIIKGRLLSQDKGEYVVENKEAKIIIKVDNVEMVKFYSPSVFKKAGLRTKQAKGQKRNYFFSLGVNSPKRIVRQSYREYFAQGEFYSGSFNYRDVVYNMSSVTGRGIIARAGLISPVIVLNKIKNLEVSLITETSFSLAGLTVPSTLLDIGSINNRIISLSLVSKTSYSLNSTLAVYLAAGEVFAREWYIIDKAVNPAIAHSFVGLVLRGGVDLAFGPTAGLNLSLSRYWEQGVGRWDMGVEYVF